MRAKLLGGVAFGAILLAAPSVILTNDSIETNAREAAYFDPLNLYRALCRSGDRTGMAARQALFIGAAKAYARAARAEDAATPPIITGIAQPLPEATVNDEARRYLEQGLGWLAGFNHSEAVRNFRAAQSLDPDCALCLWGEAFALGPNINAPMSGDDNPRAIEAAEAALAKAEGASPFERALAEALQTRYAPDAPADRVHLDVAFAAAMRETADRFPDNDLVQALAVEASMDEQPWDYWEADGLTPKGSSDDALRRVETVLARNPDHAASIHLLIHMTEATQDPWQSLPHITRLPGLAPASGHLVHMPSHIYFRIGRFEESLKTNIDAVAADEAYLDDAGDAAGLVYRYGYYPHNIHFALTSSQMGGDGETALEMADRLDAAMPMEMADLTGWIQAVKAAPLFARVQFGDAETLESLLAAPMPQDPPPYLEAAWHYARGEAAARLGRADLAREEADALAAFNERTDWETAVPDMPGEMLVEIMRHIVLGRTAMVERDLEPAIDHLIEAVRLQDELPYLEPPWWWYPTRQTLAAALLIDGQADRAERELLKTLVESPSNGWAYWGLAEARRQQQHTAGHEAAMAMWRDAWIGETPPALERL